MKAVAVGFVIGVALVVFAPDTGTSRQQAVATLVPGSSSEATGARLQLLRMDDEAPGLQRIQAAGGSGPPGDPGRQGI